MGRLTDLAFRIGGLDDNQLVARRVGNIRWVVVGSPDYLPAHGAPQRPEDVFLMPCVGVDHRQLAASWRFGITSVPSGPDTCRILRSHGPALHGVALRVRYFVQQRAQLPQVAQMPSTVERVAIYTTIVWKVNGAPAVSARSSAAVHFRTDVISPSAPSAARTPSACRTSRGASRAEAPPCPLLSL